MVLRYGGGAEVNALRGFIPLNTLTLLYRGADMNKDQRARICAIIEQLSKLSDELDSLQNEIEEIKDEEEEKYDNLPDSLRDGEKGDQFQEGIECLDDAYSYLSDCVDAVESVVESLNAIE